MERLMGTLRTSGLARELAFFGLYFVLIGLGLFTALIVWREALYFVFYAWLPIDIWWSRFLYMGAVVLGSFALVVGLLVAEPYLNEGKQRGELGRRFKRTAVWMVACALGYLIIPIGRATAPLLPA